MEFIGYLILCPLAFVIGYLYCHEQAVKQDQRETPLRKAIFRYKLDAAFRAGQQNPASCVIQDAPIPLFQEAMDAINEFAYSGSLEPLFPDADKAQDELRENGRISVRRIKRSERHD